MTGNDGTTFFEREDIQKSNKILQSNKELFIQVQMKF